MSGRLSFGMVFRLLLLSPLLGLSSLSAQVSVQWQRFTELVSKRDTAAQFELLTEWRRTAPDDPELYIAWFNHWTIVAKREVLVLSKDVASGTEDVIQLLDADSTKGPAGYLYGEMEYDPVKLGVAFAYIDTGISKFPHRLDMRFGKIHMLGESHDHERFTDEVVRTIKDGKDMDYQWRWSRNEALDDPKAVMYDGVQEYLYQLFNVGDDQLLPSMARICTEVLVHEPRNIESLSTLGSVHMMQGDLDSGIELLLRAERLAPNDCIILGNLGQAHERKDQFDKAIDYYEKMVAVGDEEAATYARSRIAALKK